MPLVIHPTPYFLIFSWFLGPTPWGGVVCRVLPIWRIDDHVHSSLESLWDIMLPKLPWLGGKRLSTCPKKMGSGCQTQASTWIWGSNWFPQKEPFNASSPFRSAIMIEVGLGLETERVRPCQQTVLSSTLWSCEDREAKYADFNFSLVWLGLETSLYLFLFVSIISSNNMMMMII